MSDELLTPQQQQMLKMKALIDGNRRAKGKVKKMAVGEAYIFRKVYYEGQLLLEPFASNDTDKIDIKEGDQFVTGYLHEVLTAVPK